MPTYQAQPPAPTGVFGSGLVGLGDRYARQDFNGADFTVALLSGSGVNSTNSEIPFLPCADTLEPCPLYHNNGIYPVTITAGVRNGTATAPVIFQNGQLSIVIPPHGWVWGSALIRVQKNVTAYCRTHTTVASGQDWPITHSGGGDLGENGTDLTDKSTTGTIGITTTQMFGPYQMLYRPDPSAVALACVGDSIASSSSTGNADNSFIRRACAGAYSFLYASQGASTLADIVTNALPYPGSIGVMAPAGNRILLQRGNNDIYSNGVSLATYKTRAGAAIAYLSQFAPVWVSTITPRGTADSVNTIRANVNDWYRDGADDLIAGVVELADAVETSRGSGTWIGGYVTGDNTHPTDAGAAVMAAATVASGIFA